MAKDVKPLEDSKANAERVLEQTSKQVGQRWVKS
jgi:hypothetical protein